MGSPATVWPFESPGAAPARPSVRPGTGPATRLPNVGSTGLDAQAIDQDQRNSVLLGWLGSQIEHAGPKRGEAPAPLPAAAPLTEGREVRDELLERVIQASRQILDLPDNWDDEGALHYEAATWRRAIEFLRAHAREARTSFAATLPEPRILPGPNGSIDLHWSLERFDLLINFPADPALPAGFYGDDRRRNSVRGTLDPAQLDLGPLHWLIRRP